MHGAARGLFPRRYRQGTRPLCVKNRSLPENCRHGFKTVAGLQQRNDFCMSSPAPAPGFSLLTGQEVTDLRLHAMKNSKPVKTAHGKVTGDDPSAHRIDRPVLAPENGDASPFEHAHPFGQNETTYPTTVQCATRRPLSNSREMERAAGEAVVACESAGLVAGATGRWADATVTAGATRPPGRLWPLLAETLCGWLAAATPPPPPSAPGLASAPRRAGGSPVAPR